MTEFVTIPITIQNFITIYIITVALKYFYSLTQSLTKYYIYYGLALLLKSSHQDGSY